MFFVLFSCLRFRHLRWDKYWSSVHREKVGTTETVCSRLQPIMWQTKRKNTQNQKKKWKGFVADMQFAENALPNKFLDKQSHKIVLVFPSAVLK